MAFIPGQGREVRGDRPGRGSKCTDALVSRRDLGVILNKNNGMNPLTFKGTGNLNGMIDDRTGEFTGRHAYHFIKIGP